jgi:hypothetical protein
MITGTLHTLGGFRLRELCTEDLIGLADVLNATYPDEPTTLAEQEHWERVYPQDNPRLRFAAETEAGEFIGFGQCVKPFWRFAPGVYTIYAASVRAGATAASAGRSWRAWSHSLARKAPRAFALPIAGRTSPARSTSWSTTGTPPSHTARRLAQPARINHQLTRFADRAILRIVEAKTIPNFRAC